MELVAVFKAAFTKGEEAMWSAAEACWLAVEDGHSRNKFAKLTGQSPTTIVTYFKVWEMKQAQPDLSFPDAAVLAIRSPETQEAMKLLADATGKSLQTVKSDTEAINTVRDFIKSNPEMMKEALEDDETRSEVVSAAYAVKVARIQQEDGDKVTETQKKVAKLPSKVNHSRLNGEQFRLETIGFARNAKTVTASLEKKFVNGRVATWFNHADSSVEPGALFDEADRYLSEAIDAITQLRSVVASERAKATA